jgi:hypothetical protein
MKIKEILKEAAFGGEVIDLRDLPDKMQRKVSDVVKNARLGSYSVEDDLKGQWIYIVFKGGPKGSQGQMFDLGNLSNANQAGAEIMLVKNKDVALALRQRG